MLKIETIKLGIDYKNKQLKLDFNEVKEDVE